MSLMPTGGVVGIYGTLAWTEGRVVISGEITREMLIAIPLHLRTQNLIDKLMGQGVDWDKIIGGLDDQPCS